MIFSLSNDRLEFADVEGQPYMRMAPGKIAKRLGDLMLHDSDLDFAEDCLKGMSETDKNDEIVQSALWYSAVVHVYKCFGDSKSRGSLSADKVFKNSAPGMGWFKYFHAVRNKHFVHDENAYSQAVPMVSIPRTKDDGKIGLHPITATTPTINEETVRALRMIIEWTRKSVQAEIEVCKSKVLVELEAMSMEDLINLPKSGYDFGTLDNVHLKRSSI